MEKPKNRPKALENVSDQHYDALYFGWKINEGLRNGIEIGRLKAYADWFLVTYLKPHLEIEKKYIFPILGMDKVHVKKALANHRRLLRLFNETDDVYRSLNRIEEEIGSYIRFEEKILLKQIQAKASPAQLKTINDQQNEIDYSDDEWDDRFWDS